MNKQKRIFSHWKVLIFCMCYYIPWALVMYLLKDNYTVEPGAYFPEYPIITIIIVGTCLVFPWIYGIYGYLKSKSLLITNIIHLLVTIITFIFILLFVLNATIGDIFDILRLLLVTLLFSAISTFGCFVGALTTKIVIKISRSDDERKIFIISIISIAIIIYWGISTINTITNIIRIL